MGKTRRVLLVIGAVLMVLLAVFLLYIPEKAYLIVAGILAVSMMARGIARVIYYFRMARNMVGGHSLLYTGILMFDVGLFVYLLTDVSPVYIMLYLIGMHASTGGIGVMRALEKKKLDDPSWKWQLITGLVNVAIALLCLIFIRSGKACIIIYSFGLIVSAISQVITAFRKTAIVYIA